MPPYEEKKIGRLLWLLNYPTSADGGHSSVLLKLFALSAGVAAIAAILFKLGLF
jgi:hypothetical protein